MKLVRTPPAGKWTQYTDVTQRDLDQLERSGGETAVVVSARSVSLHGRQVIDGLRLSDRELVLLIAQHDPTENGIWRHRVGAAWEPVIVGEHDPMLQRPLTVRVMLGTQHYGTCWHWEPLPEPATPDEIDAAIASILATSLATPAGKKTL